MAWGGLFGTGWGLGRPYLTPLAKTDFIAAAARRGDSGVAGLTAIILLYGLIVARGLRTALRRRGPVRQAAGRRPGLRVRAAGLRDPRRRHPAAAADRPDHAVHVPGRVVAGRELGDDRRCCWSSPTRSAVRGRRQPGGAARSLASETQAAGVDPDHRSRPPEPPAPVVTGGTPSRRPPGPADDVTQVVIQEGAAMNGPIRRVAVVAMVMFLALIAERQLRLRRPAADLARRRPAEPSGRRRPVRPGPRPDPGRQRPRSPRPSPVKDRYKFQRTYAARQAVRPGHRLLLLPLRRVGAGEVATPRNCPAPTTPSSSTGWSTWPPAARRRAARVETTLDARAQKAACDALGGPQGCRGRARLQDRRGPGAGDHAQLRPQRPGHPRPRRLATRPGSSSRPTRTSRWRTGPPRRSIPPGSTFKLVTAAAALEDGMTPDAMIDAPHATSCPAPPRCRSPGTAAVAEITLTQALQGVLQPRRSRDSGSSSAQDALRNQAEKFGFGTSFLTDVGGAPAGSPTSWTRPRPR